MVELHARYRYSSSFLDSKPKCCGATFTVDKIGGCVSSLVIRLRYFTIALVPLVRQKLGVSSIYQVKVTPTWYCECTLESFCFFQHMFLILGLLLFVLKVFN